jgi:hypothetical protein
MKNFLNSIDLKTLLIIGLIILLVFSKGCKDDNDVKGGTTTIGGKTYQDVKHTVDTIIVPKIQIEYRPGKTIYKERPIFVSMPREVDTAFILKDYYSKVVYKDTLKLKDSLGYISVIDTISENKIKGRVWNSQVNQIIIKDTKIVKEIPVNQLYIGGVAGFDRVNIVNYVGPTLTLKTKKDKLYSLGVGYGTNKQISIQGGIFWKIKLKK